MAGLGDLKDLIPNQDGGIDIEFGEQPDDVPVTNERII